MKFVLSIIRPKRFIHSDCFYDTAEPMAYALRALGHSAEISENAFSQSATTIMFGAHLLAYVPPKAIVYNLEQWGSDAFSRMLRTCQNCRVWDYSESNIKRWNDQFVYPAHVPIGYAPEMTSIQPADDQDIDVLFYGSGNERRAKALIALNEAKLRTVYAFPVYRVERDKLVARAKVVLNLQFYDAMVFNITRIAPALANKKAVVSELSNERPEALKGAFAECPYQEITETCRRFVENKSDREWLEARGFEAFSKISLKEIMEKALERTFGTAAHN